MAEVNSRNSELHLSPPSILSTWIRFHGTKGIVKAHCGLKARLDIIAFTLSGFCLSVFQTPKHAAKIIQPS